MFSAELFTIAKTWKQPKCPLIDKWIKRNECRLIDFHLMFLIQSVFLHLYNKYNKIIFCFLCNNGH